VYLHNGKDVPCALGGHVYLCLCRTSPCLVPRLRSNLTLVMQQGAKIQLMVLACPYRPSSDNAGQPALLMESLIMAQQFGTAGVLLNALPALRDDALLSCYARRVSHLEL